MVSTRQIMLNLACYLSNRKNQLASHAADCQDTGHGSFQSLLSAPIVAFFLSQLHTQRLVHPQSLPDAQIEHDLFATARDGIGSDIAVQPLDLSDISAQPPQNSSRRETRIIPSRPGPHGYSSGPQISDSPPSHRTRTSPLPAPSTPQWRRPT